MLAYIPRYANLISDKFPPWLCMYTIIRGNSSKNRPAREQQTSLQLDWQLNNRQRYKPTGKQPNDGGTNRPATHASNSAVVATDDQKDNSTKTAIHSVLEQIQEIWHDTVSRLVWLQS